MNGEWYSALVRRSLKDYSSLCAGDDWRNDRSDLLGSKGRPNTEYGVHKVASILERKETPSNNRFEYHLNLEAVRLGLRLQRETFLLLALNCTCHAKFYFARVEEVT
jgi:hypothetical protein